MYRRNKAFIINLTLTFSYQEADAGRRAETQTPLDGGVGLGQTLLTRRLGRGGHG